MDPPFIGTPTRRDYHLLLHPPAHRGAVCCSQGVQTAGLLSGGETEAERGSRVPAAAPAARTFHAPTAGTRCVPSSPVGPGAAKRVPCPPGRSCSGAGHAGTMPAAQPDPVGPRPSPRPAAESLGTDSLGPASGASVSRREDEKVLVGQGLCTPGPGAGGGMLLPSQPQGRARGCGSPGAAEDSDPPNTPPREEEGCRGLPRHT